MPSPPSPALLLEGHTQALNAAMDVFIHQHIVERATPGFSGFCSTFFPRLRRDGPVRIIQNLKSLYEYVEYCHFKWRH